MALHTLCLTSSISPHPPTWLSTYFLPNRFHFLTPSDMALHVSSLTSSIPPPPLQHGSLHAFSLTSYSSPHPPTWLSAYFMPNKLHFPTPVQHGSTCFMPNKVKMCVVCLALLFSDHMQR
jgi:hypothetical protein